ncbi:MAG: DUF4405 domain-containing protein [Planctomycetaceae bacterium]
MSGGPSEIAAQTEEAADAPSVAVSGGQRRRHTPRWTVINYWVDLVLLVIFIKMLFATGVVYFVFPAGPRAFECQLWGLDFNSWRDLQFAAIAVLAGGVVLHLMLHWNWLCSITNTHVFDRPPGRDDGSRTLLGVGLLVAVLHILGIGLLTASYYLQTP